MSEEVKENIKAYYIGNDIDKVLDYIQQKENIIKEVRKYIEIQQKIFKDYDIAMENQLKNVLEILDKESQE